MRFAYPWVFSFLLLFLPTVWLYTRLRSNAAGVGYASISRFKSWTKASNLWLHVPLLLRMGLLGSLLFAAARPQLADRKTKKTVEGLDIVLAIDTSSSMLAMDFSLAGERQNRLQVVKHVVESFIKKRSDDRIGLVIFGSQAFTQAPLTLDHEVLLQFLRPIEIAMAGPETAIGDGLAIAVKRLKDVEAKSKIVILMTDGSNTAGTLDPKMAMEAAKALGIKIYAIGVGSNEPVPYPVQGFFGTEYRSQVFKMDEALLQLLAQETGGRYFLASDTATLEKVYATIDTLEKTRVLQDDQEPKAEWAWAFLLLALGFYAAEQLLAGSRWRVVP